MSCVGMVFLAQPIAKTALSFSSPDYFAVVLLGLTTVVTLSRGSMVKAFISLFLGMLVTTVGVDAIYGSARYTFGSRLLMDGIDFMTVMCGAYGIGEVLTRLGQGFTSEHDHDDQFSERLDDFLPDAGKRHLHFPYDSLALLPDIRGKHGKAPGAASREKNGTAGSLIQGSARVFQLEHPALRTPHSALK